MRVIENDCEPSVWQGKEGIGYFRIFSSKKSPSPRNFKKNIEKSNRYVITPFFLLRENSGRIINEGKIVFSDLGMYD